MVVQSYAFLYPSCILDWAALVDDGECAAALTTLEQSAVVVLPYLRFLLLPEERRFLSQFSARYRNKS